MAGSAWREGHSRRVLAAGTLALTVIAMMSCGDSARTAGTTSQRPTTSHPASTTLTPSPVPAVPAPEFAAVAALIDDAIAAHRLPGAVVEIGHNGAVAYRQAFGVRKLAGEPGLYGSPTPAEPMTVDTMFDLASLSKIPSTAVAVMQLYEQGRIGIDDPLQSYLPAFNPTGDPRRAQVTVRMLLTHYSGIAGDLSLDAPWGLNPADKAEGIRRALAAQVVFPPGELFHYSDINFVLLGAIVEKLSGEPIDVTAQQNIFTPLDMANTRYLPPAKACGPHWIRGTALVLRRSGPEVDECAPGTWSTDMLSRIAPTARDDDNRSDPTKNPDFGHLLRGTVHDPTARRMGGVAGSAGVFSTAADLGRFAQALLDRLAGRPSDFPLNRSTVELMTTPQQPGHDDSQLEAANQAAAGTSGSAHRLLAPSYPAIAGQNLRGFGFDIDTGQSSPRGALFPVGSFGHTGFTGTTLWIDPASDTYVVILANVIHQPGGPPIARLSGEVATTAARILQLYRN